MPNFTFLFVVLEKFCEKNENVIKSFDFERPNLEKLDPQGPFQARGRAARDYRGGYHRFGLHPQLSIARHRVPGRALGADLHPPRQARPARAGDPAEVRLHGI